MAHIKEMHSHSRGKAVRTKDSSEDPRNLKPCLTIPECTMAPGSGAPPIGGRLVNVGISQTVVIAWQHGG